MVQTFLVIPPDYDHYFPPLATPVLAGFLKARGHAVRQWDLNIDYREFLVGRIQAAGLSLDEKRALLPAIKKAFFTQRLGDRYYGRFLKLSDRAGLPYLPYDNLSNSSFHFAERLLSSSLLERYLADEDQNTFLQSYRWSGFLEALKKEKPPVCGLSVTSPAQALAALTLGRWIKTHLPQTRVVLGGQWPTLYREPLMRDQRFFDFFDTLVLFEGETSLATLASGRRVSGTVNIVMRGERHLRGRIREEDLDLLPCPDFDGLPLNLYTGVPKSRLSLPYETSRGCYWSRCAYCVDLPLPRPTYRRRDPRRVVRDLAALQKRYGADHFMLSDPGLSPRQMREVSSEIIRRHLKVRWWCMARLDPGFSPSVFRQAAAAGLEQINFGFESASDRVCASLDKGNVVARSQEVIRRCKDAGIKVGLQTMLGLPGETEDEAWETVSFLLRNRAYIDEPIFNEYYLTPSCEVYFHPERYGIRFQRDARHPFRFFHPFVNMRGITQKKAFGFEKIYRMLLNRKSRSKPPGIPPPRGTLRFSLCGEEFSMKYV